MTEVEYLDKMTGCGCRDLAGDTPARRYQIIVSGRLGLVCCEAFRDLQIDPHGMDTALTGELNRSGLHDVLTLIQDLALDLVGLTCLAPAPNSPEVSEPADQTWTSDPCRLSPTQVVRQVANRLRSREPGGPDSEG